MTLRSPLRLVRAAATPTEALDAGDGRAYTNDEVIARLTDALRGQVDVELLVCQQLEVGDLRLDLRSREVSRGGVPITCTGTEFELLRFLMRHPRQVLSREEILAEVWRYDFGGRTSVVDLYLHYLHKKVDAGRPPMIHPVGESGYLLAPARRI
ncbi:hypothetical protein BH11ACT6_BH11ACT6_43660 [soil metagenome]